MSDPKAQDRFAKVIASLSSPAEVKTFLGEILTPTERHDLMLRWELLERLEQGVPQRRIASELGISLCKITRGARILKTPRSLSARLVRKVASSVNSEPLNHGTHVARKS